MRRLKYVKRWNDHPPFVRVCNALITPYPFCFRGMLWKPRYSLSWGRMCGSQTDDGTSASRRYDNRLSLQVKTWGGTDISKRLLGG